MAAVEPLRVPIMGTEAMAPLLYSLLRFTRPRTVVEGGCGYTTPFIAQALRDNHDDALGEHQLLLEKTRRYVDALDRAEAPIDAPSPMVQGLAARLAPPANAAAARRQAWIQETPALADPTFYGAPHVPRLFAVERFSSGPRSASQVRSILADRQLTDFVTFHEGEFWAPETLATLPPRLDFVWIDVEVTVRDALSLLGGPHGERLNPDGGMVAIHCMLTSKGGLKLFDFFKRHIERTKEPSFEVIGLVEPHKLWQNNCVLLRKISRWRPEPYDDAYASPRPARFEDAARALLRDGDLG